MKGLLRLVVVAGLAVWAWRRFVGGRGPAERASVSYADGSSVVLESTSPGFDRLAEVARSALAP